MSDVYFTENKQNHLWKNRRPQRRYMQGNTAAEMFYSPIVAEPDILH